MPEAEKKKIVTYEIDIRSNSSHVKSAISEAILSANLEKEELQDRISDTTNKIKNLTPECDKVDYALAASSGVLCGLLDIFLVAKPGQSLFTDITDSWYKDKVSKFAKLNGCSDLKELEDEYKVPYDQTRAGSAFKDVFNLTPFNHHFKSLAHNPSLFGLFFSILDQFSTPNLSHFVSDGELLVLVDQDSGFALRGRTILGKFFCAFINWIGHLISDVSGSSGSKGRGMGLPSPLWTWSNDIIAVKRSLHIDSSRFDKAMNEMAQKMYLDGYDLRFQTAQGIPVFINEMVTRFLYLVRRLIKYFAYRKDNFSLIEMWKECEPFKNASVKRMLTVAHGTFCLVDLSDVIVGGIACGGGYATVYEMCVRLNVVGLSRFTISLIGEANRKHQKKQLVIEKGYLEKRNKIVDDYLDSLNLLAEQYDDEYELTFIEDLKSSQTIEIGFKKSSDLSIKRGGDSLKSIEEVDSYFKGKHNE